MDLGDRSLSSLTIALCRKRTIDAIRRALGEIDLVGAATNLSHLSIMWRWALIHNLRPLNLQGEQDRSRPGNVGIHKSVRFRTDRTDPYGKNCPDMDRDAALITAATV